MSPKGGCLGRPSFLAFLRQRGYGRATLLALSGGAAHPTTKTRTLGFHQATSVQEAIKEAIRLP